MSRPALRALSANQQRAIDLLSCTDGLTRAELASQLGLPKATVAGLIGPLVLSGWLHEAPASPEPVQAPATAGGARRHSRLGAAGPGAAGPGPGRRPRVVRISGPAPAVGAIVYSGDLLCGAVVDWGGRVLGQASQAVGAKEPLAAVLHPGILLLRSASKAAGLAVSSLRSVVLGVPAPVLAPASSLPRRRDGERWDTSPAVAMSPGRRQDGPGHIHVASSELADELSAEIGTPCLIENDANLGALGEGAFGAGKGCDSFLYLRLARGVGSGLVVGGRLHRGATGFAGELGHVQVLSDGPLCACGGRGCLHGILGDAIVQAVQPAYERSLTLRDVFDLAANGEPGPRRVLGDIGRTIGRPLADFATLFNPTAIIVDGSFAPAADYVVSGVREALDRYAAPVAAAAVSVRAGALGDDADILGAVALCRQLSTARVAT